MPKKESGMASAITIHCLHMIILKSLLLAFFFSGSYSFFDYLRKATRFSLADAEPFLSRDWRRRASILKALFFGNPGVAPAEPCFCNVWIYEPFAELLLSFFKGIVTLSSSFDGDYCDYDSSSFFIKIRFSEFLFLLIH